MKSLVQLYLFEIRYSLLDIRYSLFLFSFFVSHSSFAQEDTAIVRTYGGPYYEEGRQIIECAAGGYAIIGTTGSDQQNNTNIYLLRLDEELNCTWSKSLGGPEVEWGYSLLEDADGNFLLCGYTNSYGAGAYDVLVYKVDAEGEVIWQQTFGGTDWDFAYKIIAHPEEGYLICGKTYSMGNGGSDGYLLHLDDEGELISEWTYGGEGDDEFVDVEVEQNQFVIAGNKEIEGNSKMTLFSVSLTGMLVNENICLTYSNSYGNGVEVNESLILFFGYYLNDDGLEQFLIRKINTETNTISDIQEAVTGNFATNDLVLTNHIITVGDGDGSGFGGTEMMLQERDLNGFWIVGPTFGDINDDHGYDILLTIASDILMVGSSEMANLTSQLYLVKWPGNELFQEYSIAYEAMDCQPITSLEPNLAESVVIARTSEATTVYFGDFNSHGVALFDMRGSLIQKSQVTSSLQIQHGLLSSGIYILVIDNKTATSKKLIIAE